jgi:L-amino acid N-acyltransferase YncA
MIRQARLGDLERMVAIYNEAIEDRVAANCDVRHDDNSRFAATYFADTGRYHVLAYEHSEKGVTAWAALKHFSARPDDESIAEVAVYVARGTRARGIGVYLLRELIVCARAVGFDSLVAIILGRNTASLRGCKACGFNEKVRIPSIARLHDGFTDIVWLQKNLLNDEILDKGERDGCCCR